MATPAKLVLENQFGEVSINVVQGGQAAAGGIPIPGVPNGVLFGGATAPVDGTTGDNFAAKGSLYIAADTGAFYVNTGTVTASTWKLVTVAS